MVLTFECLPVTEPGPPAVWTLSYPPAIVPKPIPGAF